MTITKAPPQAPTESMPSPAWPISVSRLSKHFGPVSAVDGLSFEVTAGTVTGFLGANGAGKTTTLRLLLGLAQPTAGSALILGQPYTEIQNPGRAVGAVLDTETFHPRRTGRDHLRWLATVLGAPKHRVEEVLATVGLELAAHRPVGEYSLGMKQRLGLAAALLGEPQVLVLDEPGNGLDPAGIRWLRSMLREFAAGGGTVFVSSHQLLEIATVADEVIVIEKGRLVTHTSVQELTGAASATTLVRSPAAEALRTAVARAGATAVDAENGAMHVVGLGPEQVGEIAAANGIVLHGLTHDSRSLEDVFLALTREEANDVDHQI